MDKRKRQPGPRGDELAYLTSLANIGELVGPVAHEVNDFLNTTLLHLAVLEAKVTGDLRADLAEIRQQGAHLTELIQQLQRYRRQEAVPLGPVDLNQIVTLAAADRAGPSQGEVLLQLAPSLSPVLGAVGPLKHLSTFLIRNAVGAAGPGGQVWLRTELGSDHVILQVEDSGPSLEPEQLAQAFQPSGPARPGTQPLELAACFSLVKRFKGNIGCHHRPEGGVIIRVELPLL
jgi:signal transduction histidine kinase